MIDPCVSKNPVGLIRMKKKDGTFLFSDTECERWIEVIVDRAKAAWLEGKACGEAGGESCSGWIRSKGKRA
jgi:hypothetical protein